MTESEGKGKSEKRGLEEKSEEVRQNQSREDAEARLRKQIEEAKRSEQRKKSEQKDADERSKRTTKAEKTEKSREARSIIKPPGLTLSRLWGGTAALTVGTIRFPRTGDSVPPGWNVIDRYSVNSGFAYATIAEDPIGQNRKYFLDEVPLTESEARIYTYLLDALEHELLVPRTQVDATRYFAQQAAKIARKYSVHVGKLQWAKILYFAQRDVVGFGQLDGFMRDSSIEDISVDGTQKPVFIYHGRYERLPTNVSFEKVADVSELIGRFAHISGRHVSTAYPIVQGTLPGGHRMMGTYMTEVSPHGGTLSIRRFRADPITIIDMLNLGVMDYRLAAYTWLLIENNAVAFVVGATGSGKTTTLNALLTMTRTNTKIITIEEVQEINLAHPNWTPFVARERYGTTEEGPGEIGLFDLVKAAMRMRPDIIVVGEVRGEEAYVLFQAISTGHGGLCTLHADDVKSAVQRLISKPMDVPPAFIPFLDLVFTVRRVALPSEGNVARTGRRILAVDEVVGVDQYRRAFTWDAAKDIHVAASFRDSKKLQKVGADMGVSMEEVIAEIDRRGTILKWMQRKGIRNFREITPLFEAYVKNPNETYQRALSDLRSAPEPAEVEPGRM